MKKLAKLKISAEKVINEKELMKLNGGGCPSNLMPCYCDYGYYWGCVYSIAECMDVCEIQLIIEDADSYGESASLKKH